MGVFLFILFLLILYDAFKTSKRRSGRSSFSDSRSEEPDFYSTGAFSNPESFYKECGKDFPSKGMAYDYWARHHKK